MGGSMTLRIEKIRAWHEKARHGTPDNYRFGDSSSDQAIDELIEISNALLAERDALRAEVTGLQRERAVLFDKLNGTPCAEVRWQQERDALAEDAARYRWLRDSNSETLCAVHIHYWADDDMGQAPIDLLGGQYLDDAIDAAIRGV